MTHREDPAEALTLEKIKVVTRLQAMETALEHLIEIKQQEHKDVRALLEKHSTSLYGNGHEGLMVRMDRLEQIEKNRLWAWRTVFGCVVGLVVKAFFDMVVSLR